MTLIGIYGHLCGFSRGMQLEVPTNNVLNKKPPHPPWLSGEVIDASVPNQKEISLKLFVLWSHSVGSISLRGSNPPSVVTSSSRLDYSL